MQKTTKVKSHSRNGKVVKSHSRTVKGSKKETELGISSDVCKKKYAMAVKRYGEDSEQAEKLRDKLESMENNDNVVTKDSRLKKSSKHARFMRKKLMAEDTLVKNSRTIKNKKGKYVSGSDNYEDKATDYKGLFGNKAKRRMVSIKSGNVDIPKVAKVKKQYKTRTGN